MSEKENAKLVTCLEENQAGLRNQLRTDHNFDIIERQTMVADRNACLFFVDGFVKDEIMEKLMEFFYSIVPEDLPEDSGGLFEGFIPYIEVNLMENQEEIVTGILSGMMCLMIDGYSRCFLIDCRTYPVRSVEEPEKDKVLRGSRDGFVETIIFNTALIRRRIRDPNLSIELCTAGTASKTDIVLCYMQDRADLNFLHKIQKKITTLKVDALTMNQESLAECLYPGKWWNPFPKFKYTERPDTAAACLLEGKIVLLVDNSPSAMILPAAMLDILEEADDYYFPPITGTYLRLSRFLIALFTLFLTPVWLLLMQNPDWIPAGLDFIRMEENPQVPLILQLLLLELAIDGLRLAAINTPSMLTTPLSVIAGITVGEYAVGSGWFSEETMLYMAFVAISNYTQASYELGYAFKFMRILLLILTFFGNLIGFCVGIGVIFLFLLLNRTVSGESYLYPLLPLHIKKLGERIFRRRIHYTRE
ncbi:MAG: spore germination protein [Lachnospiraceae bacterium]|nr:spore germination protein [Lachnospiraceae bacterium]MDD3797121.1 spore germination protein [Lachnospiraceae bacterium]